MRDLVPSSSVQNGLVGVIGSVTLGVGASLAIAPEQSTRALGLGYSPGWTHVLGAADAALGVALLSGRRRRRWMHVRAAANLALAGLYAGHLGTSPRRGRTAAGMAMMAMITVTDGALARTLPREARSADSRTDAHEDLAGRFG